MEWAECIYKSLVAFLVAFSICFVSVMLREKPQMTEEQVQTIVIMTVGEIINEIKANVPVT